ncbi:KleE stable inheritance protein [Pseudomonas juntendi]|uniref:KleE stable inheritance protein n=1 Tax=Pseudomonas juntendi TaxID=2666183 RepID=UPI003B9230A6
MASNVYKFPRSNVAPVEQRNVDEVSSQIPDPARAAAGPAGLRKFWSGAVWVLWFVVSAVWPVLRWFIALDVVFQGVRMAWYWEAPGVYAGWAFLAHFTLFVALTYFVVSYNPRAAKS